MRGYNIINHKIYIDNTETNDTDINLFKLRDILINSGLLDGIDSPNKIASEVADYLMKNFNISLK